MSYWFLPRPLDDALYNAAIKEQALLLPAEGLADISRTEARAQIEGWLRQLDARSTPESIAERADHFWKLGHDLLVDDYIIVRAKHGVRYTIGEISGAYRLEKRPEGVFHCWPVSWQTSAVSPESAAALSAFAARDTVTEITDEHTLQLLKPYIPALQNNNARLFRWVAIITLFFELIYFWPR